jgi:branched-chain amino acid transport system permease protein
VEQTVLFLLIDGLTSGAIYALVALSLVLVYSVTRVLNIAQGEFVTLGALTVVSLLSGKMPGTVYLLIGGSAVWGGVEAWAPAATAGAWRLSSRPRRSAARGRGRSPQRPSPYDCPFPGRCW